MLLAARTSLIVVIVIPVLLSLLSTTPIITTTSITPILAFAAATPTSRFSQQNRQNRLQINPNLQQAPTTYKDQIQKPPVFILNAIKKEETTTMMKSPMKTAITSSNDLSTTAPTWSTKTNAVDVLRNSAAEKSEKLLENDGGKNVKYTDDSKIGAAGSDQIYSEKGIPVASGIADRDSRKMDNGIVSNYGTKESHDSDSQIHDSGSNTRDSKTDRFNSESVVRNSENDHSTGRTYEKGLHLKIDSTRQRDFPSKLEVGELTNRTHTLKSVMSPSASKMVKDSYHSKNEHIVNLENSHPEGIGDGLRDTIKNRNNSLEGSRKSFVKVESMRRNVSSSEKNSDDRVEKKVEEVHGFLFNNMRSPASDSDTVLFHQEVNGERNNIDDNSDNYNINTYYNSNDKNDPSYFSNNSNNIDDFSKHENINLSDQHALNREKREIKTLAEDDNSDTNKRQNKKKNNKNRRDKKKSKNNGKNDNDEDNNNNNNAKTNKKDGSRAGYKQDSNGLPSSPNAKQSEVRKDETQLEGYWEKTNKANKATNRRKPAFWSEDIQVGCRELRARRYITDGFCTSEKAIKEVVCAGHCLPIKDMPWYAEFVKTISRTKLKDWQCVEDNVQRKRVKLVCRNQEYRYYRIKVVKSCKCKKITRRHNRTRRNKRKGKKRRRKSRKDKSNDKKS